jgi:uncharacterized protein YbjT (DUF2867 family)
MTALITGATGNVGSQVVKALAGEFPVRVGLYNLEQDRAHFDESEVEVAHFDFTAPETFAGAMQGAQSMFLVRPPSISDVDGVMVPVIEAAAEHGIGHVVFLSLQGVEDNPIVPHHKIEERILESGLAWTFLRCGFFMQNLSTTHQREIRERDVIMVPAGDSRTAFIDVRDIGAVGALTLRESGHANTAYELTGSQALTYHEVADVLSEVLGRPIEYPKPSVFRFVGFQRRVYDSPWAYIGVMTMLYTITRFGNAENVSPDVERLLGRPPIGFRQFAVDNRECWQ